MLSLENTSFVKSYEIIYVDSNSIDNSAMIAKKCGVNVIQIVDGYTSAALGRYLGKKFAKYENYLFLDSDMYLDKDWFNDSREYYEKYGAIIGERYEKLYKDNKVIKEIPNFYDIDSVEIAKHIGGFLMINNEMVKDVNYSPLICDEEEKDFYAKFYDKGKIYKIPVTAYVHNNYNLSTSKIKNYVNPYSKNGYLLSMFKSIKDGYFINYLKLQKMYLICVVVSIVFYFLLAIGSLWAFVSLSALVLNGTKTLKGSLMTTFFFPYKLLMSLFFLTKKRGVSLIIQDKKYELELSL